jgi:hypothetical protein
MKATHQFRYSGTIVVVEHLQSVANFVLAHGTWHGKLVLSVGCEYAPAQGA